MIEEILANPIWAHPALNILDFIFLVIFTLIIECGLIGYVCWGLELKRTQIFEIEFAVIIANILTALMGWVLIGGFF